MILTIARREWQRAFFAPLAWGLLAANQGILGWIFLGVLERFSALEAAQQGMGLTLTLSFNLFGFGAVLLLLSAPPLAMGLISGERREGTFALLNAAPLSLLEILLGKFLGLVAVLIPLACLPLLLGVLLAQFAPLDLGLLAAATLGLCLCACLFAAVGLFASSCTEQPGLAAVLAYGILILLSVIGNTGGEETGTLFAWLSWNEHLFSFLTGMVRGSDLLYFSLFTVFFLALSHRQLANQQLP